MAESQLNVDGIWQNWLTQPRVQVNVQLLTNDVGKLLTRFGYPEGVRRGTAKVEGALAWSGSPQHLDYPTLTGNFVLDAAKGQFVKLEPGIGKLLGILSLQSLPRRITLDFRDIFSDGLAFDEIVGAIKVVQGVASTENLRITGPAARINTIADQSAAEEFGLSAVGGGKKTAEELAEFARMAADGRLVLPVRSTYHLPDVVEAFHDLETGHGLGKVVLLIP